MSARKVARSIGKLKFAFGFLAVALCLLLSPREAVATDRFADLCADRFAIERVYYNHRTGTKPPFEQTMPRELVEKLEREYLRKEAALKNVYGVEITTAMLGAEVERINTTTRAPEMLAELKAALGNDPARFEGSVARPIVVERELRSRFENDAHLHQPQRRQAERARKELLRLQTRVASSAELVANLKASSNDDIREITWQLTSPDEVAGAETASQKIQSSTLQHSTSTNGLYSIEGTLQLSGAASTEPKPAFYFADLAPELQRVLRAQLRKPGDISAVIEMSSAFLLFVVTAKDQTELNVVSLTVPKKSYEQWLVAQPDVGPITAKK